jgi:hypothetical protein
MLPATQLFVVARRFVADDPSCWRYASAAIVNDAVAAAEKMNAPRGSKRASHMHESDDLERDAFPWTTQQACPHLKELPPPPLPPGGDQRTHGRLRRSRAGDLGPAREKRLAEGRAAAAGRQPERTEGHRKDTLHRRGAAGPWRRIDNGGDATLAQQVGD